MSRLFILIYFPSPFGLPIGTSSIRKALNELIREHDLPAVVFHSLRHTSVITVKEAALLAGINPATGKRQSEYVTLATIRDIHKLLRNCFQQAVKWELMAKNPVIYATVPKYKSEKREIWTAETLMHALEVCEDESSIRKVFLPKSVAEMLVEWKKGQDKIKETLGDEYMDYNLVMASFTVSCACSDTI